MIHSNVDSAKKPQGCPSQNKGQDMAAKQKKEEEAIKNSLSKIKHKIFVLSGKGGVGKSSVSANLAASLSKQGYKTGLMDVDVHGPSIAQMLGLTELLDISANQMLLPKQVAENLKVVSVQALMQDKDQAIIWRGPAKTGMIRQFVSSVDWGELDFLIIDAPPGTGDEPLTVVQTIPEALGVIVTTPQEVALADIRKSISFCKTVRLKTLGIVENMAGFSCPHCHQHIDLFSSGGGEKTAKASGLEFLGSLPFETKVVASGDSGTPMMFNNEDTAFTRAFDTIVQNILKQIKL
ncbi:MAG: Mrp/NBP35 family ATP-binding protein [Proteobacteria bacterium]|nr:Mrp/NBP35 family ATP-binding protein [Pseudomonadota bacterium]MBU1388871.1 Mrp/NBP35 family ATP-binding protein [Pseudomonadota bacterium]MBU1542252.1 Mrp/NBP35 family ATP-binding protein [Pseudomonadota bacterium]MBU2480458.1 Mrp/NBP35 family ATP-binding protein [Pseudomonadota bacterium]